VASTPQFPVVVQQGVPASATIGQRGSGVGTGTHVVAPKPHLLVAGSAQHAGWAIRKVPTLIPCAHIAVPHGTGPAGAAVPPVPRPAVPVPAVAVPPPIGATAPPVPAAGVPGESLLQPAAIQTPTIAPIHQRAFVIMLL
jgi:hypothetical protein